MGLLGKIIKRQSAEDSEDLDFDDEMVDSLDMPDEEGGSHLGILGKILNRRRKDDPEDADEAEDAGQDEADRDEADRDEDPGIAEGPPAPEEDSPVQVVRLEGIPDVHPVGDPNSSMISGQEQTGAGQGSEASAGPETGRADPGPGPGTQPAANSPPAEGNTPGELDTATEADTTEDSSNTGGGDLALSLQDIFGEEQEVDESLRDLADFVEETLAQDLADELREFLEELEARQK